MFGKLNRLYLVDSKNKISKATSLVQYCVPITSQEHFIGNKTKPMLKKK